MDDEDDALEPEDPDELDDGSAAQQGAPAKQAIVNSMDRRGVIVPPSL
jgi:hypothetical protein